MPKGLDLKWLILKICSKSVWSRVNIGLIFFLHPWCIIEFGLSPRCSSYWVDTMIALRKNILLICFITRSGCNILNLIACQMQNEDCLFWIEMNTLSMTAVTDCNCYKPYSLYEFNNDNICAQSLLIKATPLHHVAAHYVIKRVGKYVLQDVCHR